MSVPCSASLLRDVRSDYEALLELKDAAVKEERFEDATKLKRQAASAEAEEPPPEAEELATSDFSIRIAGMVRAQQQKRPRLLCRGGGPRPQHRLCTDTP